VIRIHRFACEYHPSRASSQSDVFTVKAEGLEIQSGRVSVLVGDNGSGKSTFFKGLSRQSELVIKECNLDPSPTFTYVNQNAERALFTELTAGEAFFVLASSGRVSPWRVTNLPSLTRMAEHLPRALQEDLLSWEHKRVEHLSGGQRALLAVSAAATRTVDSVLLLDEPAAGLDRWRRQNLAEYLRQIARERKWPIVVSSHQQDFTEAFGGADFAAEKGIVTRTEGGIGCDERVSRLGSA
jgi:ABC-type multidrug transport system ATPase subunit